MPTGLFFLIVAEALVTTRSCLFFLTLLLPKILKGKMGQDVCLTKLTKSHVEETSMDTTATDLHVVGGAARYDHTVIYRQRGIPAPILPKSPNDLSR